MHTSPLTFPRRTPAPDHGPRAQACMCTYISHHAHTPTQCHLHTVRPANNKAPYTWGIGGQLLARMRGQPCDAIGVLGVLGVCTYDDRPGARVSHGRCDAPMQKPLTGRGSRVENDFLFTCPGLLETVSGVRQCPRPAGRQCRPVVRR